MVAADGRLGVVISSARYKHDVRDMGEASSKLMKLRPVTFRYNNDPTNTLEYGLVAEDVAKVYPELVTYGADGKGRVGALSRADSDAAQPVAEAGGDNQRQAKQIQHLADQHEQDAAQNRRLSTEVAQMKVMFEQAIAAQKGTHLTAAAFFNR